MSINTALSLFLEEYPNAKKQSFSQNSVANFVRNDIPDFLRSIIGANDRYLVQGSAGQGNWANVPWLAIYDRFVTDSVQDGYYVVYLVQEDFSGVYLSLNQGVTTIKQQYGSDTKSALVARANDYLARLNDVSDDIILGPIDLNVSSNSGLGALYEKGAICSKYYKATELPSDEELEKDLHLFLNHYFSLFCRESAWYNQSQKEDDEVDFGVEDLRKVRLHKRIERNQHLAKKVKELLGVTCQACGFSFESMYGQSGKEFIEAHHLTPLSELKGSFVQLDPKKDFAVLCSNCHRMIHRSPYVSDVESFRTKIIT